MPTGLTAYTVVILLLAYVCVSHSVVADCVPSYEL